MLKNPNFWLLLACGALNLVSSQAQRADLPIQEVTLSDGTARFAVPMMIGGSRVLAGLDSGSTGLRVLPAAQKNLEPTAQQATEQYGSGVVLNGPVARAQVQLGTITQTIDIHQVMAISCTAAKPDCGASKLPLAEFGILGDGLPRQGFQALLGIRPSSQSNPPNPLIALSVQSWIIDLPQPGSGRPGHLILNPNPEETADFLQLQPGKRPGQAIGCLARPTPVPARICAPTVFDKGAPGMTIFSDTFTTEARQGAPATLSFTSSSGRTVTLGLRLDDRAQMTRYHVAAPKNGQEQIRAGVMPYLALDVLYSASGTVAIRPRVSYPGGPALLP